jgi:hypothetical protein
MNPELQLQILKAVKASNLHKQKGGMCDSFYLCIELENELSINMNKYIYTIEEVEEAFPLFRRSNAFDFTDCDNSRVWFNNDIERHAFLSWMIEETEKLCV